MCCSYSLHADFTIVEEFRAKSLLALKLLHNSKVCLQATDHMGWFFGPRILYKGWSFLGRFCLNISGFGLKFTKGSSKMDSFSTVGMKAIFDN